MLAQAYLGSGEVAAAKTILEEGAPVEAKCPWETPQIELRKASFGKARLGSAADLRPFYSTRTH